MKKDKIRDVITHIFVLALLIVSIYIGILAIKAWNLEEYSMIYNPVASNTMITVLRSTEELPTMKAIRAEGKDKVFMIPEGGRFNFYVYLLKDFSQVLEFNEKMENFSFFAKEGSIRIDQRFIVISLVCDRVNTIVGMIFSLVSLIICLFFLRISYLTHFGKS